jgi:hypothetical protein
VGVVAGVVVVGVVVVWIVVGVVVVGVVVVWVVVGVVAVVVVVVVLTGWHWWTESVLTWLASESSAVRRLPLTVVGRLAT